MENNKRRDDFSYYRLSSFLLSEGELEIKKISSIKRNVFYIESFSEEAFILKAHQKEKMVHQQWGFFDKINSNTTNIIPFKEFPNGNKTITNNQFIWTISPYIVGRQLNYKNEEDRKDVTLALKAFHEDAMKIHIKPVIKKTLIIERWHRRMQSFQRTKNIFLKHGFANLYMDIVQLTERYLSKLNRIPWSSYEVKALKNGTWIHGDVASHNFIKRGKVYLIDFDLLSCAPHIYDYIQLGQRFLPYVNWDLDKLLSYNIVPRHDIEKWLLGILVPSDVMREWRHYLSSKSKIATPFYLQKMEQKWMKRKKFSKAVNKMLKSIY
ncbi:MAG TPA: hypothetical protein VK072_08275 [Candidatus Avamphibacillus sp.]|nr:hypothetical protein [Candidatus Avamphibacillus sp.]